MTTNNIIATDSSICLHFSPQDIALSQWNTLAQTSAVSTWFQTSEAYRFFASLPRMFMPFVYAVSEADCLKGVVVGYVTVERSPLKQFFTRRAIIMGGPLLAEDISSEALALLLQTLQSELRKKAIYVETRNFNDYSPWRKTFEDAGFTYRPHLNFHVDTRSVEWVDSHLGKSRKRDLKTSFRDGASIVEQPTLQQVRDYYTILRQLYKTKIKTPLFPWEFFEQLYNHPAGRFLLVERNGMVIGGLVGVLQEGKTLFEWFVCGRDGEWKSIFPSSVATYAGLIYAAEHGCARFDMMGAGTPDQAYGVREFKAKFGGELLQHGRFLSVLHPFLYRVGVIGVQILKKK